MLIRITVSKLPKQTRAPKPLWLWWHGPTEPDLTLVWQAYRARFQLEHTFKFVRYHCNWTTPRVRHPEQADRWTQLVLLAYTMLRLARPVVADLRLPWERPLTEGKLTPYRVRRALSAILPQLPRVANPPKPCGYLLVAGKVSNLDPLHGTRPIKRASNPVFLLSYVPHSSVPLNYWRLAMG